jgi:hypothetical protein
MTSWHTYPSIYALGHRAVRDLLLDTVLVEEKVDGSQFSFGVFEHDPDAAGQLGTGTVLRIKSKGADIDPDNPPKMFAEAVETAKRLRDTLIVGWTYRGEVLQKPKHNVLAYSRVPAGNIILFDINIGEEEYLGAGGKVIEAARLGLEIVPEMYSGPGSGVVEADIRQWLERESCLGGVKVEGVVIKNYARFGVDKKALMGKFVSEAFKEKHAGVAYGKPSFGSVIDRIVGMLRTEARWQKAVQHLSETGAITDSPKDIGAIIKEVHADLMKEETDFIKEALFKEFRKDIVGGAVRGVAEWYKQRLLEKQFEEELGPVESTIQVEPYVPEPVS